MFVVAFLLLSMQRCGLRSKFGFHVAKGVTLSDSFAFDTPCARSHHIWMPWLVCFSAGLFFFYEFFQLNAFDVINTFLRAEYHLDAQKLSWLSSSFVWANVLFLLPAGIILDRCSARWVILSAMSLCVIGTIGFALTHQFVWAACFHALTGIGNAFCFLSCVILVARWFSPRRQAFVIGCIVTLAFIGGMMAHTPLVYLNQHYGWRNALLLDGAVGAVILVWLFGVVHDVPRAPVAHYHPIVWLTDLWHAVMNRQNWLAGIYTACLNLPIMVLCALWGASYLQTMHQLSPIVASNIVSLIFMGSIMGCPIFGWLSDRHGQRKPIMLLGAVMSLLLLLPLMLATHLTASSLSLIFFGLGFFTSTQVIGYPLIAESNPVQQTGAATGLASILIMGGGGLGQIIFGSLLQYHAGHRVQQYSAMDFQFAIWLFPLTVLLAIVVCFWAKETYCKNQSLRSNTR